jgi:prevent-host-death family protein
MPRVHLQEDIRPLSEFRAHTAALLQQVRKTKRALVLTQRGHSAAVVVDVAEYEGLIEELELLRDIHAAERQLAEGRGIPHQQAQEQILTELPS